MADITITVPNGQVTRIQNAFSLIFNHQPSDPPINTFVRIKILEFIRNIVKQAEGPTAANAAIASVDSDITGP